MLRVGNDIPNRAILNTMTNIRLAGDVVAHLALRPLALASVEQLVADTLACDRAACRELAELLHEQTQGNPFFLNEMLRRMEQVGAIVFSPEAGRWRWHIALFRTDLPLYEGRAWSERMPRVELG